MRSASRLPETWTPLLIGLVSASVLLYGLSKTAMPVAGVLAGPILVAAPSATTAAAFAVPLLIAGDLIALGLYRQHADWGLIRRLIPGVLIGFALTAALFYFVDVRTIGRIVGVLILVSVGLEIARRRGVDDPAAKPMTLYLVKMRVSMLAFMGTSTWFFFVVNVMKVPIIAGLGLMSWQTLIADLVFLPLLVIGAIAGTVVFRRMNLIVFTNVALALSALAGGWLLIHG